MNKSQTLGERLYCILKEKEITIPDLANKTGRSSVHVTRWCSDDIIPNALDLSKIANALDIKTSNLVELLNL